MLFTKTFVFKLLLEDMPNQNIPGSESFKILNLFKLSSKPLGLAVQKPIDVNPRLKINKGVYFSTPKYCSTLIFGKTLHYKKPILKNINKQKKFSPNC